MNQTIQQTVQQKSSRLKRCNSLECTCEVYQPRISKENLFGYICDICSEKNFSKNIVNSSKKSVK